MSFKVTRAASRGIWVLTSAYFRRSAASIVPVGRMGGKSEDELGVGVGMWRGFRPIAVECMYCMNLGEVLCVPWFGFLCILQAIKILIEEDRFIGFAMS